MNNAKLHVFLTGMMGTGKSTVGKELAKKLNCKFIDLDDEIIKKAGKSIETIFTDEGEASFRTWEMKTAQELNLTKRSVIATGGGFPLKEANRDWMSQNGKTIWLSASAEHILDRIKDENRPLLPKPITKSHIENILNKRLDIYQKADLQIDTEDKSPDAIADEIIKRIR
ncbi:MAG: shikimate kinase [Candidatus Neomarinimicrobiota bacterium]